MQCRVRGRWCKGNKSGKRKGDKEQARKIRWSKCSGGEHQRVQKASWNADTQLDTMTSVVPARTSRHHATASAACERYKIRAQVAKAAIKNNTASLALKDYRQRSQGSTSYQQHGRRSEKFLGKKWRGDERNVEVHADDGRQLEGVQMTRKFGEFTAGRFRSDVAPIWYNCCQTEQTWT